MDLTKISNDELLVRLERLAKGERKITHLVLWHINEMESRKLYADLGFGSMYEYLTKYLGYGESSAYRRIQSARLLKQIPHLSEKLEDGSLNLTQLTQVQKCLKEERKTGASVCLEKAAEILEKIENKSNFETQKVLALEFNQPIQMHEVIKPQRDGSVKLELSVSFEQMERWKQVRDLLSHSLPDGSWVEVIDHLAEAHLKKVLGKNQSGEEGLETEEATTKGDANEEKRNLRSERSTQGFFAKQKRGHIKITVRRRVLEKAHHCCEFVDPKTNQKCGSTYQLQVDHKIPLARGGSNDESNLRVLCRTHNLLSARQWGLPKNSSSGVDSRRI